MVRAEEDSGGEGGEGLQEAGGVGSFGPLAGRLGRSLGLVTEWLWREHFQ